MLCCVVFVFCFVLFVCLFGWLVGCLFVCFFVRLFVCLLCLVGAHLVDGWLGCFVGYLVGYFNLLCSFEMINSILVMFTDLITIWDSLGIQYHRLLPRRHVPYL